MDRGIIYYDSGTNMFKPVPQSGGAPANTPASVEETSKLAAKSVQILGTLLAAGWTGTSAPYTQVVSMAGVTAASTNGIVSLIETATTEQVRIAAEAVLRPTGHSLNSITITAAGFKPTADLPIVLTVWF